MLNSIVPAQTVQKDYYKFIKDSFQCNVFAYFWVRLLHSTHILSLSAAGFLFGDLLVWLSGINRMQETFCSAYTRLFVRIGICPWSLNVFYLFVNTPFFFLRLKYTAALNVCLGVEMFRFVGLGPSSAHIL